MFDENSKRQIANAAVRNNIEPAALLAVAEVESAGIPFWNVGGKMEPAIRFEGHYFNRILGKRGGGKLALAQQQGLASPKAGRVKNPNDRGQRYALLARAKAIDVDAAIESVSWGLGQVMGSHWKAFGLGSARELEAIARSGVSGQIDLMIRFIRMNKLTSALNSHDWHKFARAYNGANYAAGGYHTKMAKAYARHRGATGDGTATEVVVVPPVDTVEQDIRAIQVTLKNLGYDPGTIDGDWGPNTQAAVIAFQRRNGLPESGVLDENTLDKIRRGGLPLVDPNRANEGEKELAEKGSETIQLSKRGRLLGIVSMIAGALGFGGENGVFDGFGQGYDTIVNNFDQSGSFSQILKLGGTLFGASGGGMWVILFGLAFMFYRNSKQVADRRVQDHRQGYNVKY